MGKEELEVKAPSGLNPPTWYLQPLESTRIWLPKPSTPPCINPPKLEKPVFCARPQEWNYREVVISVSLIGSFLTCFLAPLGLDS